MNIVPSPSRALWRVETMFLGKIQPVFTGDLFACLHWVKKETGKPYQQEQGVIK